MLKSILGHAIVVAATLIFWSGMFDHKLKCWALVNKLLYSACLSPVKAEIFHALLAIILSALILLPISDILPLNGFHPHHPHHHQPPPHVINVVRSFSRIVI
ncbi:hypothetical protein IKO50_02420 [bacterium]|nr:hypothetical protein [bacterium]